jgi:hypothetical protein
MIVPSLLLITSLASAAFAAPGQQPTPAQLLTDLDIVGSGVVDLSNKLAAIPSTGCTMQDLMVSFTSPPSVTWPGLMGRMGNR